MPASAAPIFVHARPRVLHAVRRYGETSQTFIADAVLETQRAGWDAWVLSQHPPRNRDVWPFPGDDRMLVTYRPALPRGLVNRGLRRSPRRRQTDRWLPLVAVARPAVLHLHFGWVGAGVQLERFRVPTVVSFHGNDATAWPHLKPSHMAACRRMFETVDRVTVVSRYIERHVRSLGFNGRLDLLPAGVRLEKFPFVAREPAEQPRLLFVGRLVTKKGLDVLLDALPALLSEHPGLRLMVVGDGPERLALEGRARRLGVGRVVDFAGAQPPDEVREAMQAADIVVTPSRVTASGEAEGSAVVTKEAYASGAQVVVTDAGGLIETVPPELRHEACSPDDPAALVRRIDALLSARADWPARARLGRDWVEREFDWAVLAARLCAIYHELAPETAVAGRIRRHAYVPAA